MLRGLYIAGTGMLTQMKRMDVTANNIANATTNGYKKDLALTESFGDVLLNKINSENNRPLDQTVGPLNYGIHIDDVVTVKDQGPLEFTGEPLDMAIAGEGFFTLETPDGIRYTRNGSFTKDVDGFLVGSDGYRLMGQTGPIQIPQGEVNIDKTGNLYVNGFYIDTISVTAFNQDAVLEKEGNNIYSYAGGPDNIEQFNGQVRQGYLEGSNVDVSEEMVDMIEISRNYTSNQRILRMYDDILSKTVNDVGRV